jgi:hypothetical protein
MAIKLLMLNFVRKNVVINNFIVRNPIHRNHATTHIYIESNSSNVNMQHTSFSFKLIPYEILTLV